MHVESIDANVLARNWWVVMLHGFIGILFGVVTIFACMSSPPSRSS